MSLDAGFLKKLKIVNGSLQVCLTDTFDGKSYGILTGIENAVFAGAVILELQQYVAVVKLKYVFGLSLYKHEKCGILSI